ncbi:MAG: hypothetical protein ACE5Q6_00500 [Dehalococcoidia bacterium]
MLAQVNPSQTQMTGVDQEFKAMLQRTDFSGQASLANRGIEDLGDSAETVTTVGELDHGLWSKVTTIVNNLIERLLGPLVYVEESDLADPWEEPTYWSCCM